MSGQIWLLDLPEACRSGGLDVDVYDGWETRSRSSGGYDDLLGIGYHHDASSTTSSEMSGCDWGWKNSDDRPIGAMRLWRNGHLIVGAAGATNTMGKGGPLTVSGGTIPQDRGNQTMIAIEAANNGVGETWPKAQVDAYIALVAALCAWYGLDPSHDIFGHFDYCAPSCPSRKIDPAGPAASPYTDLKGTNSSGTWKLSAFRNHVIAWSGGTTPPPPSGGTYTVVAGDSWYGIARTLGCTVDQLLAANPPATTATVIHPGDVLNTPAGTTPPPDPTPPDPTPPPSGGDWMATLPTIRKGDRGDYVERMQHLLAAAGYMDPANAANYDGVWGSGTDTAKAKFDNAHGLTPSPPTDCGSKSWESLMTGRKW